MALRIAAISAVVALLIVGALQIDLEPNLARLDVKVLSGSTRGQYYATVARLEQVASEGRGHIENVSTRGSVDNLERLQAAVTTCDAHFAIVQDGSPWGDTTALSVLARLPTTETLFLVGKRADEIGDFADLDGLRIGIGPKGSGTARLMRQVTSAPGFSAISPALSNHPGEEQLRMVEEGELDLAAFVIAKDAELIARAVRERGLQIASLDHAKALAHHIPSLRGEVLRAGHYDPVRVLPPKDKVVLEVDTLVLGNGCASRSASIAMLTLLRQVFPGLIRHNLETPNQTGLPLARVSESFFANGGPDLVDEYAPWLADLVPVSNLGVLVMAVSILFNVMGAAHRFRLWRIDANRVNLENRLPEIFGPTVLVGGIADLTPTAEDRSPDKLRRLDELLVQFVELLQRCRRHSISIVVPMGQEMSYRYQENLIEERIGALRGFRDKLGSL